MSVQFEAGDLVLFRHMSRGVEAQSAGIVIGLDDGLLTIALPHGIEIWNMRSALFGSAWRMQHTPHAMTEDEALEFAARRLAELRGSPPVLIEPEDDRAFANEPHAHHSHDDGAQAHVHARAT